MTCKTLLHFLQKNDDDDSADYDDGPPLDDDYDIGHPSHDSYFFLDMLQNVNVPETPDISDLNR